MSSISIEKAKEIFENLESIVAKELGDLFFCVGKVNEQFSSICNNIRIITESIVIEPQYYDLSEEKCNRFLVSTLPILVEAIIKRPAKNVSEEEITNTLLAVVALLAQPAAQDLTPLCSLRNLLLTPQAFSREKFIFFKPEHLKATLKATKSSTLNSEPFFVMYGRSCVAINKDGSYMYFWSDEWEKDIGDFRAIGHFIQIRLGEGGELKQGLIVDYFPDSNLYAVKFDREDSSSQGGSKFITDDDTGGDEGTTDTTFHLPLHKMKILWVDTANKQRLSTVRSQQQRVASAVKLKYTNDDEGIYVRIWWTLYKKYFYGLIITYDTASRKHSVIYEDGDIRAYDMTRKEFDIIHPPATVTYTLTDSLSEAQKAQLVAKWHLSTIASTATNTTASTSKSSATNSASVNDLHTSTNSQSIEENHSVIVRPGPDVYSDVSLHQLNLIDEFFTRGGATALFNSYIDTSQPSPSLEKIQLHLNLLYSLRIFLNQSFYKGLIWDAKEVISTCFNRYDDVQLKDFSVKVINDIFKFLKELILYCLANSSQNSVNTEVSQQQQSKLLESFDFLRLVLAKKLLYSSQLQKRYIGLSIIKELIDYVAPKISHSITKRSEEMYGASTTSNSRMKPVSTSSTAAGVGVPARDDSHVYGFVGNAKSAIISTQVEEWLLENEIIEELFGSSLHQDLAVKSDIIWAFLGHRRALQERHIELLWMATKGAHEAVTRVLYNLILFIVPLIESNLRYYLFGLIASVPSNEYSEQLLHLIKNYTVQVIQVTRDEAAGKILIRSDPNIISSSTSSAMPSSSSINETIPTNGARKGSQMQVNSFQRKKLGFSLLWQFVQDQGISEQEVESGSTEEGLIDLGIQLLVELLQVEFQDEREVIIQKCLDNVYTGVSVPVSLQIMRQTLATYPLPSKSWFQSNRSSQGKSLTISGQIEKLQQLNKLFEVFFDDLARYQKQMSEKQLISNQPSRAATPVPDENMKGVSTGSSLHSLSDIHSGSINNFRASSHGKRGRTAHLKGISERLEFLKFIISNSDLTMNTSQMLLSWNVLGEGAITIETLDKYVTWLASMFSRENKTFSSLVQSMTQETDAADSSQTSKLSILFDDTISNNINIQSTQLSTATQSAGDDSDTSLVFEEGVLINLFQNQVVPWGIKSENISLVSRRPVAAFCLKLFILVNLMNKAIRVEFDGSWCRVGQLVGVGLLWRIALDSSDTAVAEAAITLLIELHHRLPSKLKGHEIIRIQLLRQSFKYLARSVQSLRVGETATSRSNVNSNSSDLANKKGGITSGSTTSASNNEWLDEGDACLSAEVISRRVARLILISRSFIHRFYHQPISLLKLQILAGREDGPTFTLTLKSSETLLTLKKQVSVHFKEPIESISLFLQSRLPQSSLSIEKLDKDDITLAQAKIISNDIIMARKKDTPSKKGAVEKSSNSYVFDDTIVPEDLEATNGVLSGFVPLSWLPPDIKYHSSSDSNKKNDENFLDNEIDRGSVMSTIPCLPFPVHMDVTLCVDYSNRPSGLIEREGELDPAIKVFEYLSLFLKDAPQYVDQLLEMLDGYLSAESTSSNTTANTGVNQGTSMPPSTLSTTATATNSNTNVSEVDLSAAVWDVLQALPTHSNLVKGLRDFSLDTNNSDFVRKSLDINCPYRLLYTLQVIDLLLSGENDMRLGISTKVISKKIFDWCGKFLSDGGVEQILKLISGLSEKIREVTSLSTGISNKPHVDVLNSMAVKTSESFSLGNKSKSNLPGSGKNAFNFMDCLVMSQALLHRLLHRLLLLDPLYSCWHPAKCMQYSRITKDYLPDIITMTVSKLPHGLVITALQGKVFLRQTIENLNFLSNEYQQKRFSSLSMQTIADNSLLIIFGLLTAFDDGLTLLKSLSFTPTDGSTKLLETSLPSTNSFNNDMTIRPSIKSKPILEILFRTLCLRIVDPTVRSSVCRRVLESCANIWRICSDSVNGPPDEKRSPRIALFQYIFHILVSIIDTNSMSLQGSRSIGYSMTNLAQSQSNASLTSLQKHSSFTGSKKSPFVNAEQLYSLIALLWGLVHSPASVFGKRTLSGSGEGGRDVPSPVSPSQSFSLAFQEAFLSYYDVSLISDNYQSTDNTDTVPSQSQIMLRRVTEQLCQLFVEKLMTHSSKETFHSTAYDGALVGLIRVLLVLSSSDSMTIDLTSLIGSYTVSSSVDYIDKSSNNTSTSDDSNLITFLYKNCLFPTNSHSTSTAAVAISPTSFVANNAACQTKYSRGLVYQLLYQLCHNKIDNMSRLVQCVNIKTSNNTDLPAFVSVIASDTIESPTKSSQQQQKQPQWEDLLLPNKATQWAYDPNNLVKEPGASVGLSNQGGTCYMNSFLQQLYHTSAFSNGLLAIETSDTEGAVIGQEEESEMNEVKQKKNRENSDMLFQLQVLFAFLRVSQKRYYDTLPFCKVFRDFDGQPISLGEQKDINEFAGSLFDKLESNSDAAKLLSETLQGKFVWQVRSTETSYRSEREENFFMLTAEVKNKSSLEDSLELLVADELFTGDNKLEDPVSGRKVEALRRCAIRSLPQTLIVHFKRFEFDLETMERKKVNDLITFPMDLNMYQYTEEGIAMKDSKSQIQTQSMKPDISIDDNNITADLTTTTVDDPAVTATTTASTKVHRPASYYQYKLKGVVAHVGAIDRGHYYSFIRDDSSDQWFEYNDRNVLPLSVESLPAECFGGQEKYTTVSGVAATRIRQNNAYLLFYEKVDVSSVLNPVSRLVSPMGQLQQHISRKNVSSKEADLAVTVNQNQLVSDRLAKHKLLVDQVFGSSTNSPLEHEQTYSIDDATLLQDLNQSVHVDADDSVDGIVIDRTGINQRVLEAVWRENLEFQTDRFLYDKPHYQFIWKLLNVPLIDMLLSSSRSINTSAIIDTIASKSTGSNTNEVQSSVLSQLIIFVTQFTVEIVCHAKSKQCATRFFERLGDVLIADRSLIVAESIVRLLGTSPNRTVSTAAGTATASVTVTGTAIATTTPVTVFGSPVTSREGVASTRSLSTDATSLTQPIVGKPSPSPLVAKTPIKPYIPNARNDYLLIQRECHPWLVQMFLLCPVTSNLRGFAHFLFMCVKSLHGKGQASIEIVTVFVDKLLFLVEKMPAEFLIDREGFRHAINLLSQIALLGYDETAILIRQGAVHRLVYSLLAINYSANRISPDEVGPAVELLSYLVRSSFIPTPETIPSRLGTSLFLTHSAVEVVKRSQGMDSLARMTMDDVLAFTHKIFIDDAVNLDATSVSSALQHVCWSLGESEAMKIIEFLADRIVELVLVNAGANIRYLQYFRSFSDVLINGAVDPVAAFHSVIPDLLVKADLLATRMAPNDVDFVYAMLKFIHRLGMSSSHHHALVMSVQDLWRRVSMKMSQNKRVRYRSTANISVQSPMSDGGRNSDGGGIFGLGKSLPSRA